MRRLRSSAQSLLNRISSARRDRRAPSSPSLIGRLRQAYRQRRTRLVASISAAVLLVTVATSVLGIIVLHGTSHAAPPTTKPYDAVNNVVQYAENTWKWCDYKGSTMVPCAGSDPD